MAQDLHHAVDVQPGAVDDQTGRHVARRADQAGAVRSAAGLAHLEAGADLVAGARQIGRQGSLHVTEVDRPGGRHVERLDAARVRFDLRDSAGADALHGHPSPFARFGEGGQLIA